MTKKEDAVFYRRILKGMTLILVLAVCCAAIGCAAPRTAANEGGQDYCRIDGNDIYFVSDEQRMTWESSIAALLSNVQHMQYLDDLEMKGDHCEAANPDLPSVPESHYCALFDITQDGVPELLLVPWGGGGSAGNAVYYVFDIMTGEEIGYVEAAFEETICVYYQREDCALRTVAQFQWRGGWSYRSRWILTIDYDPDAKEIGGELLFQTGHYIDGEIVDQAPTDEEGIYSGTWVETYPDTRYKVDGEAVDLDSYYYEYDNFIRNWIRIPETALCLFSWSDVAEDEDDDVSRAIKMARALVTSEQEFVDYGKME